MFTSIIACEDTVTVRPQMFVLGAVLLVTACAAASQSSDSPKRQRNLITAEELQAVNEVSAVAAVRRLRPQWVRTSGRRGEPVVYVDDFRAGHIEALDRLSIQDIAELRYLSASDATTRYGTGHEGGAILVRTKRAR